MNTRPLIACLLSLLLIHMVVGDSANVKASEADDCKSRYEDELALCHQAAIGLLGNCQCVVEEDFCAPRITPYHEAPPEDECNEPMIEYCPGSNGTMVMRRVFEWKDFYYSDRRVMDGDLTFIYRCILKRITIICPCDD